MWTRLQIYKKCFCGNGAHVIKRNLSLCIFNNLKCLHSNFSTDTIPIANQSTLQNKSSEDEFIGRKRWGRKDSVGLVEKALVQLNSSVKKSNRIYKTDIEKILQDVKAEGVYVDKYAVLLLQCCGELLPDESAENRLNLAHNIWNNLKELGVELKVKHYNALLRCYSENGHSVSARKFLSAMDEVKPDETTYHHLLTCACEVGNINEATEIVAIMKEEGFPASAPVFNALILGHARAGDMSNSVTMLDLMQVAKIRVTAATYTALLQGFAETGDLESFYKFHKDAVKKNIQFTDQHVMKIVKSLTVSGHKSVVKDVLKWMKKSHEDNCTDIIHMIVYLLHSGYDDIAYDLLDILPVSESKASHSFGVFFLQEMIHIDKPVSDIVLLADQLMSDGRNPLALQKTVEAALCQMKVETSLALFETLQHRNFPVRSHYFWPLIIGASRTEGEKGVFHVLKRMQEFGATVDFDTLQDYIFPRIALVDLKVVVRKLQDVGLSVGTVLSPLMAVLIKRGNLQKAVELCSEYKGHLQSDRLVLPLAAGYVTTSDVKSTVKLLQEMTTRSIQKSDWCGQLILNMKMNRKNLPEPEQLTELLKALHEARLDISSFAADVLLNYFQSRLKYEPSHEIFNIIESLIKSDLNIIPTEKLPTYIPHPSEMMLEDLECHKVELESKDLNRRGLLRRLLKQYCRHGHIDKALAIKKEFTSSGFEFSPGMLAMLFDAMVQSGNLEHAEQTLLDLKKLSSDFVLDEHKLIDFATLLITKDRLKDGILLLEQHAQSHKIKGGEAVSRNCRRLLTAVAEKSDGKETRDILEKLKQLGYCKIINALLGPVIRSYMNRNDLKGAVQEYGRCVTQHKSTPLQQELMCRLIQNTEPDLLQEVVNFTTKVHGTDSVNVSVAVALAETGSIKQLRNFLSVEKRKLKSEYLLDCCKRLADEDKLQTLANLVEAGRGISWFNTSPIYVLMLQVFSRRGDYNGALDLWTRIQEKGEESSPEFLNMLAVLLESHKQEVPFVTTKVNDDSRSSISGPPKSVHFSR